MPTNDDVNAEETVVADDNEAPPRDLLVRTGASLELVRSDDGRMPILHGDAARFGEWTEINSRLEGHFMERFSAGSFDKNLRESADKIRCLFHHGLDPQIGMKPLGPILSLRATADSVPYEVELLDTDYNRSLIPGIEAGLYGSSWRFGIHRKSDERKRVANPKGLLERTITEAYMREFGPTPFPAYGGAKAGLRSLTDEFVLGRFPTEQLVAQVSSRSDADRDLVGEMRHLAGLFVASGDTDADAIRSIIDLLAVIGEETQEEAPAPSKDAAPVGTSRRSAATTSPTPLWGLNRDQEVTPLWRP